MYDAMIAGGGAAGLSAALVLGRARRKTLVIDAGEPRNAPSPEAHSFFTRDGTPPGELLRIGREQAAAYGVEIREGRVASVGGQIGAFEVETEDGGRVSARRVLLATGVADVLPEIPGVRERWGRSVLHCPYCHGWEVRDQPLAVLVTAETAIELASLLLGWSRDVVVLTNGPAEIGAEDRARMARHGIVVRAEPIARLEGEGDRLERIVFATGDSLPRAALFVRPEQRATPLVERLGCETKENGALVLDVFGETSVPGVYAAGDLTRRMQQVSAAAAEGGMAAAGINRALLTEEFG